MEIGPDDDHVINVTNATKSNDAVSSSNVRCCDSKTWYRGNEEALGWALDGMARMITFITAAVFLSTALINVAKRSVGCVTEIPEGSNKAPECLERIYGIRPSSILTTYGTVVGLIVALSLPFVGAVLDHTNHRKALGQMSALLQIIFILILCFLSERNWVFMAVVQVFSAVAGWVHTLAVFAYLPELTNDANLLVKWTANFHFLQYVTLIIFLAAMVAFLYITNYSENDLLSSRIANASSLVLSAPLYAITWTRLMKPRNATSQLQADWNIFTVGFIKVWSTAKFLFRTYRPLMWFFINVSLVEAAQASLAVISLTYMTDTLQMTVIENGISIFVLFIFAAIGTIIGQASIKVMNPIRSNQLCQLMSALATAAAAIILTGPNQQILTYIIAAFWGIGAGWKNTVERFAVTQLIPKNQDSDAEMMGFYLFSSQIFIWCPTLIFTSMNEANVDQRIGVAMLNVFFIGGIFCLCMVGPYEEALIIAHTATISGDDDDDDDDGDDDSRGNDNGNLNDFLTGRGSKENMNDEIEVDIHIGSEKNQNTKIKSGDNDDREEEKGEM